MPHGDPQSVDEGRPTYPRWPAWVVSAVCGYYAVSALTLPLVNRFWLGEFAPLALFQIPKSFIKAHVQQLLLSAVHALGWSKGSASPDFIATHDWALGLALAALPLLLVAVLLLAPRVPHRGRLIALVLMFAAIDAAVTFGFDKTSNLKLYNAHW